MCQTLKPPWCNTCGLSVSVNKNTERSSWKLTDADWCCHLVSVVLIRHVRVCVVLPSVFLNTVCRQSGRSWRCISCFSAHPARQTCWWTSRGLAGTPRRQSLFCARCDTGDGLRHRSGRWLYAGLEKEEGKYLVFATWPAYMELNGEWKLPGSTWNSSAWWLLAPGPPRSSHRSPLCWAVRCISPTREKDKQVKQSETPGSCCSLRLAYKFRAATDNYLKGTYSNCAFVPQTV